MKPVARQAIYTPDLSKPTEVRACWGFQVDNLFYPFNGGLVGVADDVIAKDAAKYWTEEDKNYYEGVSLDHISFPSEVV